MIRVIFGLGNPGAKYEQTRHNAGFMALDHLVDPSEFRKDGKAMVATTRLGGRNVLLVKPMTYMNLSGEVVQAILTKERVKLPEIAVCVDDVAIPHGQLRIRAKGSHGGQNGLRDIIARVGQDFARVRIGVGLCPKDQDLADYVLSKPGSEDQELLQSALQKMPALAETLVRDGLERAMNLYNPKA